MNLEQQKRANGSLEGQRPAPGGYDKVIAAGRDVQSAALDLASASAEALGSRLRLLDAAKDIASDAEIAPGESYGAKSRRADYVNNLADACGAPPANSITTFR